MLVFHPFIPDIHSLLHAAVDKEGSEIVTDNAKNLKKTVSEVLYAAKAASIRVSPDSEAAKSGLCAWIKRRKSYPKVT